MALTPGTVLGSFEVISAIGAGGMGQVFRARDTKLGRDVALKVLPDDFAQESDRLARFRREAQVLAALNHPNIAAIFGLEEVGQTTALVLELVEGPTLADRLNAGPIAVDDVLKIAKQLAVALEIAHEKGIVHRDLKPANIKVTDDNNVKVLDFGLAKVFTDEALNASQSNSPTLMSAASRPGVIVGTAAYMSPEQARGKSVDARADIWAFGVVLFEMLTGRPLFAGETVTDILAAIVHRDPDWNLLPPSTPLALRRLLRRCLTKDVRQRLRHMGDAQLEIDACLNPAPDDIQAQPAGTTPQNYRRERIAWAIAVLAIATAVLAVIYLRPANETPGGVRFSISIPQNSRLFDDPGEAISPDGRKLAFIATGPSGVDVLWIRPIDNLEATPLSGTEGAYFPFWSPNSESIAFFAQGELRAISASGGSVRTIAKAQRGVGGSWNSDDVIVFAPSLNGEPIYRVPAHGGEVTPLTMTSNNGGSHYRPYFFPDADHFLFCSNNGVYAGSLSTRETKQILPFFASAIVTPNEYLVFVGQDDVIKAQKIDVQSLELVGAAFPLADRALQGLALWQWMSASTTGTIAYRVAGAARTEMTWFDRSGTRLGTVGQPGINNGPVLSPDNTKIAFERDGDVWTTDLMRGIQTKLTLNPAREGSPLWSHDGRYILFSRSDGKLYRKPSSGGTVEELLVDGVTAAMQYSADGRFLSYFNANSGTGNDLYVLPDFGDRKPQVYLQTKVEEYENRLSPDGKWMAYVTEESGAPEVWIQTFPASEQRVQVSTAGGVQPQWRSDGRELYYLALDGNLMALDVKTDPKLEAGIPKALFQTNTRVLYTGSSYSPARDGKRFLVNSYAAGSTANIGLILNWPALLPK